MKINLVAYVFGLIVSVVSGVAQATLAQYPSAQDNYVNDFANVLTVDTAAEIRALLRTTEDKTGVEITVVTIPAVAEYDEQSSFESFATNLFNYWGVGNLPKNDGVMLLVSMKDRAVRIELGAGYGDRYNLTAKDIIDDEVIPLLKKGDPNAALLVGAQSVAAQIAQSTTGASSTSIKSFVALKSWILSALRQASLVVWMVGAGAILLLVFGLRRFLRYRPRRCQVCGGSMQRLDENADNAFLDAGQAAEERVSSVDYDVWQCTECDARQQIPYKQWFSGFSDCPSCHKRTLKTTSTVVHQATYTSTGTERIIKDCQFCAYHHEYNDVIPMKTRSSGGSSSSSFGGGSSSGGGASGRW